MADERRVDEAVKIARIEESMKHVEADVEEIKSMFAKYVTQIQFKPVQMIVFGMTGIVLSSVFAAVIALVVAK